MAGAATVKWTTSRRFSSLSRDPLNNQQLTSQEWLQKSGSEPYKKALFRHCKASSAVFPNACCRILTSAGQSSYYQGVHPALSCVPTRFALLEIPLCKDKTSLKHHSRTVCCVAPTLIEREKSHAQKHVEDLEAASTTVDNRILRQHFTTRWDEVGANGKARMETIANYMQETCANHLNTVYCSRDGPSSPLMKKHHLVWIIAKMHTEVDSYPSWRDVVLVESWTEPVGKNGGRRDWRITDSRTGVEFGRGTSLWVMMNLVTRRLARIPDDVHDEYASFWLEAPRYAIPDMAVVNQRLPQGEGTPIRTVKDLQARYSDLDLNRHINNVTYTSWFLEAVDRSLWETHDLCSLTIEFRQECTGEDLVESTLHAEDAPTANNGHGRPVLGELTFLHSLCLQNSRKELARARSRWRVKEKFEQM